MKSTDGGKGEHEEMRKQTRSAKSFLLKMQQRGERGTSLGGASSQSEKGGEILGGTADDPRRQKTHIGSRTYSCWEENHSGKGGPFKIKKTRPPMTSDRSRAFRLRRKGAWGRVSAPVSIQRKKNRTTGEKCVKNPMNQKLRGRPATSSFRKNDPKTEKIFSTFGERTKRTGDPAALRRG